VRVEYEGSVQLVQIAGLFALKAKPKRWIPWLRVISLLESGHQDSLRCPLFTPAPKSELIPIGYGVTIANLAMVVMHPSKPNTYVLNRWVRQEVSGQRY
jgi:hypothetical protein